MKDVVISGTGLYRPPHVITNAELVASYNAYADLQNTKHAAAIASGERPALVHSSVEFIEKASGIQQRYVIEKEGVLDPVGATLSPGPEAYPQLLRNLATALKDCLSGS